MKLLKLVRSPIFGVKNDVTVKSLPKKVLSFKTARKVHARAPKNLRRCLHASTLLIERIIYRILEYIYTNIYYIYIYIYIYIYACIFIFIFYNIYMYIYTYILYMLIYIIYMCVCVCVSVCVCVYINWI